MFAIEMAAFKVPRRRFRRPLLYPFFSRIIFLPPTFTLSPASLSSHRTYIPLICLENNNITILRDYHYRRNSLEFRSSLYLPFEPSLILRQLSLYRSPPKTSWVKQNSATFFPSFPNICHCLRTIFKRTRGKNASRETKMSRASKVRQMGEGEIRKKKGTQMKI